MQTQVDGFIDQGNMSVAGGTKPAGLEWGRGSC